MEENSSFRTAFKGFNRDDVVSYIAGLMEKISAGEQETEALLEKVAGLEREAAAFRDQYSALEEERDALAGKCERLEQERDEQEKRCAALERRCVEFDNLSKSNEEKLGAAMLDAKRFAEMLVREATDRAGSVYRNAYESVTASSAEVRALEMQMKDLSDLFEKTMGEVRRNMRDLSGRMTAFREETKDYGAKFELRPDITAVENE